MYFHYEKVDATELQHTYANNTVFYLNKASV